MRYTRRILAALLSAALLLSLLPATAFAAAEPRAEGVIIDVTDYGADPTGAKESSTAVIAALEYAKTLDEGVEKTIYFPQGEYHFYADYSEMRELYVSNTLRWNERSYANKYIGILVEGMKNVTIDGGSSLFIFHGNVCTMAAIDSENVTFTNFSEDFASPEVVDVTVESHEGDNAAILFIPACYNFTVSGTNINWQGEISLVTGQPYWSGNNGFLGYRQYLDTVTGRSISNGKYPFNNVSSITKLDDTHIKVVYSNADSRPPVGQCCQMRHPNPRKTPGTFFWNSKNVTVSNANFHFLHGFGMVSQLSENITLDTVKYQARPGTGRTSAGFADFVQMSSVGGKITIRNCDFADPHDDPINIHGTFLEVTDITADRRRVVVRYQHNETWGFPQYNIGDTVDFSVKDTLAPVAGSERTVVGVVNPGEGLNLDGTQRSKDNENDMRTIIVELNEPLPAGISAGHDVMENVTYTPEVLIEDCRFAEVPTRGILVTTRKPVVIQNNYFDRIMSSSIFISCDAQDWRESGRTEDVLITGNTFIAENTTGNGDHYGGNGIIMIWPTNPSDDPNYQIHKNIRIENNTFEMLAMPAAKRAIVAKSVNGLTIKNNLFRRYDPNVAITLAASAQSVAVGGSQATTLTSSGEQYANRLFRLQACKNIIFEGNTYDNGLNLSVQLDGNVVTAADVTDRDGVLTVGGDNQLPAVGAVQYFSSNPSVATVDASGVVTGVGAGTAEIYAYTAAGERVFESNHLTFTVTGGASAVVNKIDVTGGDTVDVGGALNLSAAVDPANAGSVTWSVKPATEGAAATITQGGVLTGSAPGVVEVTATLGGVSGSKLVTVNTTKGLDADKWTIWEETADGWTMDTDNGTVTIDANKGGGDWATGTGAKNFFLTDAPSGDFEITVKLTGNACGTDASCYSEAGLVVSVDHNNYVSVVRKNQGNSGWLSIIQTKSQTSNEKNISDPKNETIYLKLSKSGTTYTGSYSTDGTNWTAINSQTIDLTNFRVGFFATNATAKEEFTFSDFKIIQSGVTTSVPLVSANTAPTVSGVTVASASPMALSYSYADADSDAEADSLIAWYISDTQTGHYTRLENAGGKTLPVTADVSEKWVKAVVVPRDATGRYGAPVVSAAVQAPAQTPVPNDATLASLSAAGLTLSPAFDPSVTAYTIDVPPSAASVNLSAAASQAAAAVAGAGEVTLTGTETAANVTVTAPDGSTTKTYTVTIRRAAGSSAELSALTAVAGSAGISYNAATRYYQLVADGSASTLALTATAADPNAAIAVRFNGEEKGVYSSAMSLPLVAGLNHLELRVTAEDGISTAIYRVVVMKPAATNADLASLTVNGTDVLSSLFAQLDGNTATISAAADDPKATVLISVDGRAVANGGTVTLTESIATANIRVVAEDTVTEKNYTLVLARNDPASADLAILRLGSMTLSPAFDPSVTEYTATSYGSARAALTAAATQAGASVTYETVAEYASATGQISGDCRFFKDDGLENKVIVTVTSPNGENTKTYTVTVNVVESVYLSDLPWVSATSGWREVRRDYDVDPNTNNKLSLMESGQTVTYDKGLGTHANSVIEYDLSSMGFTRFTAKVGLDHSQASANTTQRLRFYVDVDGTNQYTSETLGSAMNCEAVNIDVTDAGQLTLRVVYTTANDSNAHADWADAKLSGSIPLLSETDVPIQHIELAHDSHTIYTNQGSGHTVTLHPVIKPSGVDQSAHETVIEWRSSNTSVATVNNGVVTAVGVGEAVITARALSGTTDTCTITVKQRIDGQVTVSGESRFDSVLTANVSDITEAAKNSLTYQWYRGAVDENDENLIATGETYTPVAADIGSVLVLKVTANDPYEGETTFTTPVITKANGPAMLATPTHRDVSAEGAQDGAITGLFKGREYEYLLWDEEGLPGSDAVWTPFCDDSDVEIPAVGQTYGTAEITGLGVGSYLVRRAGDATHFAGRASNTVTIAVADAEDYDLNVPHNLVGGVVQAARTQIPAGDTVRLWITPDTGYRLDSLTVTCEDGSTITPDQGSQTDANTTLYTFTMPASNVTVSAAFEKKTYTISHELAHITCDMVEHNHTVTHGEAFTVTLTPEEGYDMPRSLTLTETDTGAAFTDYTYRADPTDPAKRVLTFAHGVTRNITARGEAVLKQYTVVYTLTNGLTAPDAPQSVGHHNALSVTLTAARGYGRPDSITVEVNGTALESNQFTYDRETGTVEIPEGLIDGSVVITAQGEALGIALQSVAVVGPARVGRTLSVNTVPVLATVDYQWILVDEDGTETPIDGAVGNRYVIPAEAEGKTIRVRVTGTGGYNGTVTSEPTETVLPQAEPFVFVTSVTLEPGETSVAPGGTVQIEATVKPDNATSGILYWFSSNDAIATVDQDGLVTGVAEGTVTITARSTDTINYKSAECIVTVTASGGPGDTTLPTLPPVAPDTTTTVTKNEDGSTTTTVTDNKTGAVTATTVDPEGGKVEKVTAADGNVTITVTDPDGRTVVSMELPGTMPTLPESQKFIDVPDSNYAAEAINSMAALGIVNGVGDRRFDRTSGMKRGDLAAMLYRMSNGGTGYDLPFEDVPSGKYYADGIAWAAEVGVVTGYSESVFAPEETITREQLAVMLYRYAKLLKLDTAASAAALDDFTDGSSTHGWAVEGTAWCVENGILQGRGNGTLDPRSTVIRADVALMLQRFIDLLK